MVLHNQLRSIAIAVVALLPPVIAWASADYAREKRWAEEVTPGLLVGEPIYLTQENGHRFLGIYAEADDADMGVIVVHGMGLHPDWGLIGTLRQRLFDFGYTTLSIQMPVLAADASYKEYPAVFPESVERLRLAVAYLKVKGYRRIVIASHSNGSRMSRVYMTDNPADVEAWVSLSLTQGETFAGIKAPVLDLYGEDDLPHVLSSVADRKLSLEGNGLSKQMVIRGTNHFFNGREEVMVKAVKDFLAGLPRQP
jgi:pimeloyl-ACP methyl ester carboxylesterase